MKKWIEWLTVAVLLFCMSVSSADAQNDALRFKEEYESLSGQPVRADKETTYIDVPVGMDNPFVFLSAEELLELKQGRVLVYMGAAWCPWCRQAVPIIDEVADVPQIETIYYVDLTEERDAFAMQDGKLVKTKEGSDAYYQLLSLMDEYLSPYVITDEDGTQVDTGEKRILLPTLAVMEQGKVVSAQTLVYTLDEGQSVYDPLRPEQYDELYDMISDQMIGNVTSERPQEENAVMYFYSQSCWECAEMKPFVQGLIANNPSLNIEMYCIEEEPEVWEEACMQAGIPVWGVPRMFVGDMCFVGWSPKSDELIYYPQYYGYFGNKNQILNALQQYSQVPLVLDEAMD